MKRGKIAKAIVKKVKNNIKKMKEYENHWCICIDKWINKYKKYSCPTCRADPFSKVHQEIFSQNPHQ